MYEFYHLKADSNFRNQSNNIFEECQNVFKLCMFFMRFFTLCKKHLLSAFIILFQKAEKDLVVFTLCLGDD